MNQAILTLDRVDGVSARDYRTLKPAYVPQWLASLAIGLTLVAAIQCGWGDQTLPDFAAWSASLALALALLSALVLTPRNFTVGYLVSLLPFLIAWRVAAMNGAGLLMWVSSFTAVVLLLQFADCVVNDWRRERASPGAWLGTVLWQMTIVRLYFGLNELGHSTEKIFAGLGSFHTLEEGFRHLGFAQWAGLFVILGGLVELASAISVGLGLFARLGALVSLLYFLVATVGFGGEWGRGYAWASAGGGGWEYVMMLLVVFGSVLLTGAGKFSIDGWLLQRRWLPDALRVLCTNKAGR
ncbi:DoxX family protein [Pseudomonas sp. RIT-To-2]|uniref:DoxX family protein n=1 Tax=Pseudomonas sp. RIT-To-2 TaxID=3462541 RepID=UPI00241387EC